MNPDDRPLTLDPTALAKVVPVMVGFLRSRAPYTPEARALVARMAADIIVASERAGQSGWPRTRFEFEMLRYWLSKGIRATEVIDASGFGDRFSLRDLAFDAAMNFAAETQPTAEA